VLSQQYKVRKWAKYIRTYTHSPSRDRQTRGRHNSSVVWRLLCVYLTFISPDSEPFGWLPDWASEW